MAPISSVWALVTKSQDGKVATCTKCGKVFKSPSRSTVRYHLQQVHFITAPKKPSKQARRDQDEAYEADDPELGECSNRPRDKQHEAEAGETAGRQEPRAEPSSRKKTTEGPMDKCFSNTLSFSRGGHRDRQVTESLLFMMARDDLPLQTPEKEGIRVFCKAMQPLYTVPSEPTCTKALERKFVELREAYGRMLVSAKSIGLALELWTHSETMQSYLGVAAHFRDEKKKSGKIRNVELGVRDMPERKTAENSTAGLREVCDEWQIDIGKVKGVVTDGGANVKSAARQLFGTEVHITCAGHVINAIGQAILHMDATPIPSEAAPGDIIVEPDDKDDVDALLPNDDRCLVQEPSEHSIRSLLVEVKGVVWFFRSSEVASEGLKQQQMKQPGMTEAAKCLKLVQEVMTRWNSAYYMLERYLHLEEHVTAVLLKSQREQGSTKRKPPHIITADKVNILTELRDLLKPREEATKMLSKEKDVTLSNVIPIVYGLKQDIEKFLPTEPLTFNVKEKLISEIHSRFSGIEFLHPYAAATFLDPRYKKLVFQHQRAAAMIVSTLRDRVSQMVVESGWALEQQLAAEPDNVSSSGIWSSVDDLLRRSSVGALDQEAAGAMPSQLKRYLSSKQSYSRQENQPRPNGCLGYHEGG